MSTSENQLIRRAILGDARAWTEIVTSYSGGMYSLALRIMGSASEAEDVVQDSFIKAFGALGSFRNRSSLATWLYRITYTTADAIALFLKMDVTTPLTEILTAR